MLHGCSSSSPIWRATAWSRDCSQMPCRCLAPLDWKCAANVAWGVGAGVGGAVGGAVGRGVGCGVGRKCSKPLSALGPIAAPRIAPKPPRMCSRNTFCLWETAGWRVGCAVGAGVGVCVGACVGVCVGIGVGGPVGRGVGIFPVLKKDASHAGPPGAAVGIATARGVPPASSWKPAMIPTILLGTFGDITRHAADPGDGWNCPFGQAKHESCLAKAAAVSCPASSAAAVFVEPCCSAAGNASGGMVCTAPSGWSTSRQHVLRFGMSPGGSTFANTAWLDANHSCTMISRAAAETSRWGTSSKPAGLTWAGTDPFGTEGSKLSSSRERNSDTGCGTRGCRVCTCCSPRRPGTRPATQHSSAYATKGHVSALSTES
jgi:hypothetical protein